MHNSKYWKNIKNIAEYQRKKGLLHYGMTLEENTEMDLLSRLTAIEEELIDALFYLEHLKEELND